MTIEERAETWLEGFVRGFDARHAAGASRPRKMKREVAYEAWLDYLVDTPEYDTGYSTIRQTFDQVWMEMHGMQVREETGD